MKPTKIFAQTDSLALLRDNKIPCIGTSNNLGKRYHDGVCILIKCVEFDFQGDGSVDRFYFENDKLTYFFICLDRENWLRDILIDSKELANVTHDLFIQKVVEKYTLIEMGF